LLSFRARKASNSSAMAKFSPRPRDGVEHKWASNLRNSAGKGIRGCICAVCWAAISDRGVGDALRFTECFQRFGTAELLIRDGHQQKKLILARHNKLIHVQQNELIRPRRNKLT